MAEMATPLDDAQQMRHAWRLMSEKAQTLDQELRRAGFGRRMRREMVLTFWRAGVALALSPKLPSLADLFGGKSDD